MKATHLHNQAPSVKEKWLSSILDNTKHEKIIEIEIQKKAQFNPNLPSYYKRPLDCHHTTSLNTDFGRQLLASTLSNGPYGNIYFTLSQHFITQSDSLLCGPSSMVMVLNALGMDPQREWKYPWRWYDEKMLNKCTPCKHSNTNGCGFDIVMCIAKSNGLRVEGVRASLESSLQDFRDDVKRSCSSLDQPIIFNFARNLLGQTGTGHFSPLGAYNEEHDMILVMDTARFKYPPYWTKLETMWGALQNIAVSLDKRVSGRTGMPRGYLILRKPKSHENEAVHIRLQWQQARVRMEALSDDITSIYTWYVLKELNKTWHAWLDQPNHIQRVANESQEKNESKIIVQAVDKILNFARTVYHGDEPETINEQRTDLNLKILNKFDFPEIRNTHVFQVVKQTLLARFLLNADNEMVLNNLVLRLLDLIEIEDDDGSQNSMNELRNGDIKSTTLNDTITDNVIDTLTGILSTMFVFWPYKIDDHYTDHSTGVHQINRCILQASVDKDTRLVTHNKMKSIPEQIYFILKTIDHGGHEVVYEKPKENR